MPTKSIAEQIAEIEAKRNELIDKQKKQNDQAREALKVKLSTLHVELGYDDPKTFIKEYASLLGLNAARKTGQKKTPELVAKIAAHYATDAGKDAKNGDVAKLFNVSIPTLSNIRRELGLTRKQAA